MTLIQDRATVREFNNIIRIPDIKFKPTIKSKDKDNQVKFNLINWFPKSFTLDNIDYDLNESIIEYLKLFFIRDIDFIDYNSGDVLFNGNLINVDYNILQRFIQFQSFYQFIGFQYVSNNLLSFFIKLQHVETESKIHHDNQFYSRDRDPNFDTMPLITKLITDVETFQQDELLFIKNNYNYPVNPYIKSVYNPNEDTIKLQKLESDTSTIKEIIINKTVSLVENSIFTVNIDEDDFPIIEEISKLWPLEIIKYMVKDEGLLVKIKYDGNDPGVVFDCWLIDCLKLIHQGLLPYTLSLFSYDINLANKIIIQFEAYKNYYELIKSNENLLPFLNNVKVNSDMTVKAYFSSYNEWKQFKSSMENITFENYYIIQVPQDVLPEHIRWELSYMYPDVQSMIIYVEDEGQFIILDKYYEDIPLTLNHINSFPSKDMNDDEKIGILSFDRMKGIIDDTFKYEQQKINIPDEIYYDSSTQVIRLLKADHPIYTGSENMEIISEMWNRGQLLDPWSKSLYKYTSNISKYINIF